MQSNDVGTPGGIGDCIAVLSLRDASQLLSALATAPDLGALISSLGFALPLPLDSPTARRLGLTAAERGVRIAPGPGTLRALLLHGSDDALTRERLSAICRVLARTAPDCLWLVLARRVTSGCLAIAAAPPDGSGPVPGLEVDPARVRQSDAETLAALAGATGGTDLMTHMRWRETLGRDALTRRFYKELESRISSLAATATGTAPADARRTIALLHVSRLLFLAFLETQGWLNDDREFLRRHFAVRCGDGHGVHRRLLEPLWFGTLNTPPRRRAESARAFGRVPFLNGGLFARTPIERRWRELQFTDAAIGDVIDGILGRYRVTAREATEAWSDAAVDPEMLGRAFESLMHAETRRAQGSFYTPPALIARLAREGIVAGLGAHGADASVVRHALSGGELPAAERARLAAALGAVRVLDPACGSGAFLVFALEELATLRASAGDARPVSTRRRDTLTQNIFGVDLDPTAVWLCQLRLWLSVVVGESDGDRADFLPLPNLDRNVRAGDALAGHGFDDMRPEDGAQCETRRVRYARASGLRKRTLGHALEREERARVIAMLEQQLTARTVSRRELINAARSPDLFSRTRGTDRATRAALDGLRREVRRLRAAITTLRTGGALPFSFATHFPDIAGSGGFSLVLGNPPWVRTHGIALEQRAALRERFTVFKGAAWESGAAAAAAGHGFASQADLAALFTERAVALSRASGAIALLLPAKLWGSLAGGGVRALLAAQAPPQSLEDWSGSSAGFDAVVYPSALVATRARAPSISITVNRARGPLTWTLPHSALPLDESPGAPWLLLPPEVREAFDAITRAGIPLAASTLGRPLLGVKSGCNEAFLLTRQQASLLEPACVRPLLRGEHLAAWRSAAAARDAFILWTHDAKGDPLTVLPPAAHRRLLPWRRRLERRSDARGTRWWAIFRTEAARADRPRVVWGDIGRVPRALVLPAGDPRVPLNTCYVVRARTEDDAHALAVLLNSPLGAAWLGALAEPARGGYHRFLGWTCAQFPVPRAWNRARDALAAIGRAAAQGEPPDTWTLAEAARTAYALPHRVVAPLLSWHHL